MSKKCILKKDIIIPKGTEVIQNRDLNNNIIRKLLANPYTTKARLDCGVVEIVLPWTMSKEYIGINKGGKK